MVFVKNNANVLLLKFLTILDISPITLDGNQGGKMKPLTTLMHHIGNGHRSVSNPMGSISKESQDTQTSRTPLMISKDIDLDSNSVSNTKTKMMVWGLFFDLKRKEYNAQFLQYFIYFSSSRSLILWVLCHGYRYPEILMVRLVMQPRF